MSRCTLVDHVAVSQAGQKERPGQESPDQAFEFFRLRRLRFSGSFFRSGFFSGLLCFDVRSQGLERHGVRTNEVPIGSGRESDWIDFVCGRKTAHPATASRCFLLRYCHWSFPFLSYYQDDFVTPGIWPVSASSRNLIRQRPKRRM